MVASSRPNRKASAAVVFKFIAILLPAALLGAATSTYIAYQGTFSPEDSLRMTEEAEESVRQMGGALDGTSQGWQTLMQAAQKLYRLGRFAVRPLLKVAASKKADPMLRKMAIEIVRDSRDARAIGPFTAIARDATNPEGVRYDALYSLGDIGTDETIDSLLVFLQSEERVLREAALAGIRGLPRDKEKTRAYKPVAEIAVHSEDAGLRHRAILALSAFGDGAVPLLTQLLESEDKMIRAKAIHGLSGTRCRSAVFPLTKLLSSEDQSLRTSVIMALEDLGDPAAVPSLVRMLKKGGYDAANAARALATIGDRSAVEPLREEIERARSEGVEPDFYLLNAYERLKGQPVAE
jgi:HEAT repeat protein